jgi:heme/copper-type cytochrome/quinol oxidase subunit 2
MSYLAGLIAGIVSFIAFSIVMVVAPPGATAELPPGLRESWVLWALTIGPVSGLVIGAFAGFYRRFLRRVNPNAGSRQQARSKTAKATARR